MRRFVAISDVHAHNWSHCSYPLKSGLNSRLQDTLDALDKVWRYMQLKDIKHLVHLGDLFHVRGKPPVEAVNQVYDFFSVLERRGVNLVFLRGNHDLSLETNEHSLRVFKNLGCVVDRPEALTWAGVQVVAIPYTDSLAELKEGLELVRRQHAKLVFLHQGVGGVPMKSGYIPGTLMKQGMLPKGTLNFLGHYHEHQEINANSLYVGSLLQQNWGDEGVDKYFVEVEGLVIRKIHTDGPQFVVCSPEAAEGQRGNFVRVRLSSVNASKASKLRAKLLKIGVRHVEFVVQGDTDHSGVLALGDVSFGAKAFDQYVACCETKLNRRKLKRVGKEILAEARESIGSRLP